ncbi:MAG: bifunctional phosphoglucose/phosphomannose isomerase [Nitrososphaerales archaeon]
MTLAIPKEKQGVLDSLIGFPTQVAAAFKAAKDHVFHSDINDISNILILGMGGSGIVGDYMRVLLRNSQFPVYLNKHSIAPKFVNEKSLVLAVTYSGKTQETLNALQVCINSSAKVVVITGSHELASTCKERDLPCIKIPAHSHSRTSLGYLLVSAMSVLQHANVLKMSEHETTETIQVLKKIKNDCAVEDSDGGPARQLAMGLANRFPIIYGEYNFTDAVALRWKQQFNENAKTPCYHDVFPELLHNEIETWHGSMAHNYSLIFLRDYLYEEEADLLQKIDAAKEIMPENLHFREFWSKGRSELARLLSLTYLGDLASAYLAKAKGVDPSSVKNIELAKSGFVKGAI